MKRPLIMFLVATVLGIATATSAQDAARPVPSIEITIIPGGATTFVSGNDTGEPSFTNYDAGVALGVSLNRFVGIEGEISGSFGVSQTLTFATFQQELRPPTLLQYSGNLVASLPTTKSIVPFVTIGAGGLSVLDSTEVVQRSDTFFTGNVGSGVKWRARRWGLRVDYRFLAIRRRDSQFADNERPRPDFFGKETRFGHRVFGGITLNVW